MFYQKGKKKISIWQFRIFYDKKQRKSKIDINFQFLILNWMDEWHTDPRSHGFALPSEFAERTEFRVNCRAVQLAAILKNKP